jgi:hypothetical protein
VTVQRLIELRGIATVLITVDPEQSAQANPPRALHPTPFVAGHSLGKPNEPALQKRILADALALVRDAKEPGRIVSRDYGG